MLEGEMTMRLITRMLTSAVFRPSVKESEAQNVQRQKVMPLISKDVSKFFFATNEIEGIIFFFLESYENIHTYLSIKYEVLPGDGYLRLA